MNRKPTLFSPISPPPSQAPAARPAPATHAHWSVYTLLTTPTRPPVTQTGGILAIHEKRCKTL